MRANRAFRLIVHRDGMSPAFLADPDRMDRIELISVEDNETVLLWDLPPREAGPLIRSLRTDLAGLDCDSFLARWEGADTPERPEADRQ